MADDPTMEYASRSPTRRRTGSVYYGPESKFTGRQGVVRGCSVCRRLRSSEGDTDARVSFSHFSSLHCSRALRSQEEVSRRRHRMWVGKKHLHRRARRILQLVSREWRAAVYFTKRTVYPQPNRKRCCPSVDPQTPGSGDRWDDGDAQSFRAFNAGAL